MDDHEYELKQVELTLKEREVAAREREVAAKAKEPQRFATSLRRRHQWRMSQTSKTTCTTRSKRPQTNAMKSLTPSLVIT
jgi:hypothetical protein